LESGRELVALGKSRRETLSPAFALFHVFAFSFSLAVMLAARFL
jgi:hypothetical protein